MSTAIVPGRFEGKTAVVTGAGSGIGKATTLRLRFIDSSPALAAVGSELQERMGGHLAAHLSDALGQPVDSLRIAALTGAIGGASYAALVWWARGEDSRSPAEVIDEALVPLARLF